MSDHGVRLPFKPREVNVKYTVGDYTFEDEATAEKARKEAETISYISSHHTEQ